MSTFLENIKSNFAISAHTHTVSDISDLATVGIDDDIPKVFIDGVIPTTKDDTQAELTYIGKTLSFHSYIEIKCQGTSSMRYPKKNFTIKLFEGISLDGIYVSEKTKQNNLTGQLNIVKSKIKPKFNITRSYCEKLNN